MSRTGAATGYLTVEVPAGRRTVVASGGDMPRMATFIVGNRETVRCPAYFSE